MRVILIGLYFLATGCGAQSEAPVSGKINMKPGWKPMVYLIQPKHFNEIAADYRGLVLDSAKVNPDGSFAFQQLTSTDNEPLYIITIQKEGSRFANHLRDDELSTSNYMPVVIQQDHPLQITADAEAFQQTFDIHNADLANIALRKAREIRYKAFAEYQVDLFRMEDNDTLLIEKEELYLDFARSLMDFADTTSSVHAALVAIRWISAAGDYERMPEFMHRQCNRWKAFEGDNKFVADLCALTAEGLLPVQVGESMPDFELPLSTGDTSGLYPLLGKKITIVDLWASWCAPCRKENKVYLSPLYESYKDLGLEIIGYSLDHDETSWKHAIEKDKAVWVHASHLTGDATPFLEAIRISTIPANFILDARGKILAKNLYGQELESFIMKQLQQ
jgi:peroxiredoxin